MRSASTNSHVSIEVCSGWIQQRYVQSQNHGGPLDELGEGWLENKCRGNISALCDVTLLGGGWVEHAVPTNMENETSLLALQ